MNASARPTRRGAPARQNPPMELAGPAGTFCAPPARPAASLPPRSAIRAPQGGIETGRSGAGIRGWRAFGLPGDAAHHDGDWLHRAVAAQLGIYGNSPEEATYPLARTDIDGQPLDGSKVEAAIQVSRQAHR